MPKLVYLLYRRKGTSRADMNEAWKAQLPSIVKYPGLTSWVHNYVLASEDDDTLCDGYGEHHFENDEALWAAVNAPSMADAREEAKAYLDMERTKWIVVDSRVIFCKDN